MSNQEGEFCCSHSKKSCVVFFTQSAAVGIVLFWSMYMLSQTSNQENRDLYVSLLSASLGVFLPNPKIVPEPERVFENGEKPMVQRAEKTEHKLPSLPLLSVRNQTTTTPEKK